MARNSVSAKTVCEVGCGAGEVLRQLQLRMSSECSFVGYEISPQAYSLCQKRANTRLRFVQGDLLAEDGAFFDLLLIIDVLEHLEDYYGFVRSLKEKSVYKILHIPLELTVESLLRRGFYVNKRCSVGHIHYFSRETALGALADAGYELVDWFYTAWVLELPGKGGAVRRLIARRLFALDQNLAARLVPGFSLMVLAK